MEWKTHPHLLTVSAIVTNGLTVILSYQNCCQDSKTPQTEVFASNDSAFDRQKVRFSYHFLYHQVRESTEIITKIPTESTGKYVSLYVPQCSVPIWLLKTKRSDSFPVSSKASRKYPFSSCSKNMPQSGDGALSKVGGFYFDGGVDVQLLGKCTMGYFLLFFFSFAILQLVRV